MNQKMSSVPAKNILLPFFVRYGLLRAVPHPIRGALRDRHERWARDAVDVFARETNAPAWTAKPCGPDAPTLASSLRAKARRRRGLSSPVPRGERGAAVKTIAQGMSVVPAALLLLACAKCTFFARKARGCGLHPAFPAPLISGATDDAKLGHVVPRERGFVSGAAYRSPILTSFWRCGHAAFSSRRAARRLRRQRTVNGFGRGFVRRKGSGDADSQAFVRRSGRGGASRTRDSGCVGVHPASWRASASYRPLRAVWAVCAWALRGCARTPKPFSALQMQRTDP